MPVEQNFADLTVVAKVTVVVIIVLFVVCWLPQVLAIVGIARHIVKRMSEASNVGRNPLCPDDLGYHYWLETQANKKEE